MSGSVTPPGAPWTFTGYSGLGTYDYSGMPLILPTQTIWTGAPYVGSPYVTASGTTWTYYCVRCKKAVINFSPYGPLFNCVQVPYDHAPSGQVYPYTTASYCFECAGYTPGRGFETREDWIREGCPFTSETPCYVLADWCEEQGRIKDAQWLRTNRSGR